MEFGETGGKAKVKTAHPEAEAAKGTQRKSKGTQGVRGGRSRAMEKVGAEAKKKSVKQRLVLDLLVKPSLAKEPE